MKALGSPVMAQKMSSAMEDGVKTFWSSADSMVVALAVGRGRECVVSGQVPLVQKKTESYPLASSYPGKSIKGGEDREREKRG